MSLRGPPTRLYRRALKMLPPRARVFVQYTCAHRRIPNLRRPQFFTELVQVRKLSDDDPRFQIYADKVAVKEVVKRVLGPDWLIPTLWVGKVLPEHCPFGSPFVVKANHASGWNAFVQSMEGLDWRELRVRTAKWVETPWREDVVEPWYNRIDRQLIVEPIVGSADGLPDYKFFVFGGRVEFIQLDTDRFTGHRRAFYDRAWRKQDISLGYPVLESRAAAPPRHLAAMTEAAETLGAPFDFVRIDLYDLPEGPKFGEVTFSPNSGFEPFNPPEMDRLFGRLWERASSLN
jgi:hypothetical protein